MPDVTVPVPDERVAEFYKFFGTWLAGEASSFSKLSEVPSESHEVSSWSLNDGDEANILWPKLSPQARAVFGYLMDRPGERHTGREIADAVQISNGASGVAGVLAWPARHCAKLNRALPTEWREGEDGSDSVYWMTQEVAELFRETRKAAEH